MKTIAGLVLGLLFAAGAYAANPQVEIVTSQGPVTLELYADKSPKTVANFLEYAKSGFYKETIFHRVIPGFMAQGGGYTRSFQRKTTRPPVPIESANGLRNQRGTIAMARTQDPNSANSQFFINVADNDALDYVSASKPGYAVFGRVVKGMEVVDRIMAIPTGSGGPFPTDVPKNEVVIEDVKLLEVK